MAATYPPSVDRVRRLAQFWNWLPAFRAVGESEHLPTAASSLRVSAPALSRTVKHLEAELGAPLFCRDGRGIVLSRAGHQLLDHVRDAMRIVDDGVNEFAGSTFKGPLLISSNYSVQLSHLLPSLKLLATTHSELRPEVRCLSTDAAVEALHSGSLDVALVEQVCALPQLQVEVVGNIAYGVYAPTGHPLLSLPREDREVKHCMEHAWVVPSPSCDGDGWAPELTRQVGIQVESLGVALEAAVSLNLLIHIPDAVGRARPGLLERVVGSKREQTLYAIRRKRLSAREDRVSALLTALRTQPERVVPRVRRASGPFPAVLAPPSHRARAAGNPRPG